jgi:hypothetical protein
MSQQQLVVTIIHEMQEELDEFFRSKKAKMVKLTPDDLSYLEVMLSQAVRGSSLGLSSRPDGLLGTCAQRFLREFFLLKTKPQVQLRDSSFKLVKSMVDRTVQRALAQICQEEAGTSTSVETEFDSDESDVSVPEADCEHEHCAALTASTSSHASDTSFDSLSTSESLNIQHEPRANKNVFACPAKKHTVFTSRLFGGSHRRSNRNVCASWLRRGSVSSASDSGSESPLVRRSLADKKLAKERQLEDGAHPARDQKKLPIKKRKPSIEAIVPSGSS